MAEFPAMPLWTDAYLGDTTHLTTIEHGAYLLLLIAMWRTADNSLPGEDKMLARYTRLNAAQWARVKPVLMPFFREKEGRITQGRLTDEAAAVRQHSRKQSDRAKVRWRKNKETGDAAAMPEACQSDAPLPLPIPKVTDKPIGSSVTPRAKRASPKTQIPSDAVLSEKQRAVAIDRGLSDAEAEAQFEKFKSWALAKGQAYADWEHGWRNWLTSPFYAPVTGAIHAFPRKGRQSSGERLDDHLDALKARLAVQRLE